MPGEVFFVYQGPDQTEAGGEQAQQSGHLTDPALVAGTPEAFRRYVQQSRGEFGCAKPSYVRTRPGWVSDRTVCYLASGRPCVVEATGVPLRTHTSRM